MLHLTLLGIRTSLKEDLKCTAAELVYGTSLRLPGEFFVPHNASDTDPTNYVAQLKHTMQALRCKPPRKPSQLRGHVDDSLNCASHVFVRRDAVRKPLQSPYDGPYQVLSRSLKFYTLDLNGRKDTVSVDRLKPAHLDVSPLVDSPTIVNPPSPTAPTVTTPAATPSERTTRSGRHVHWPAHLRDFTP